MNHLKTYGVTRGAFDLPMTDQQAFTLDKILKDLPAEERQLQHFVSVDKELQLLPGERADISVISTEAADRDQEVLMAAGMIDSHYLLNPLVTLMHCYWQPPVGKCVAMEKFSGKDPTGEDRVKGIKAKTVYPARPDMLADDHPWMPDETYALIQAGLLNGKSVGFLPVKTRWVTDEEKEKDPKLRGVRRVYEKWLLLEYAVCAIPCNQLSVVQQVAKGMKLSVAGQGELAKHFGVEPPAPTPAPAPVKSEPPFAFLTLDQVEQSLATRLGQIDPGLFAQERVQAALDKHRGRV